MANLNKVHLSFKGCCMNSTRFPRTASLLGVTRTIQHREPIFQSNRELAIQFVLFISQYIATEQTIERCQYFFQVTTIRWKHSWLEQAQYSFAPKMPLICPERRNRHENYSQFSIPAPLVPWPTLRTLDQAWNKSWLRRILTHPHLRHPKMRPNWRMHSTQGPN